MLRDIADWWDAVELWVTQLAFPFQVVLAVLVVLPLCAGLAVLADHGSDAVDRAMARVRAAGSGRSGSGRSGAGPSGAVRSGAARSGRSEG